MAKNIIIPMTKTFFVEMSDEDMERMTCICTAKKKNYFDVVLACFHAGLLLLTEQCNCNICRSSKHGKEKKDSKKRKFLSDGDY